jgi:hypothetical protein
VAAFADCCRVVLGQPSTMPPFRRDESDREAGDVIGALLTGSTARCGAELGEVFQGTSAPALYCSHWDAMVEHSLR